MTAETPSKVGFAPSRSGFRRPIVSFILQVVLISLFPGTLLVGFAWWRTGGVARVWPYLCGVRLFVEPTQIDLGIVPRDKLVERQVTAVNLSSRPLKLVGAQRSCACLSIDKFPLQIGGGGERHLRLQIGTPRKPMRFEHSIKLFADDSGYSAVVVTVRGESR